MQALRGRMRIFFFAAIHRRCRKPCWHDKNGVVKKEKCRVCTEALWNKFLEITGQVFLASSYRFPVFLLFSSGILRETFANPSGAPEGFPKNVQRNPEEIPKPIRSRQLSNSKKHPFFDFWDANFWLNRVHWGKNKFHRASVHTLHFSLFMIAYLCWIRLKPKD